MSDKVVVRFLKAWRGYSADELAGFDESVADGLKSKGFAEVYEADGESGRKPAKASRASASKPNSQKSGDKTGAPEASPITPETPVTDTVEVVGGDTDDEEKP